MTFVTRSGSQLQLNSNPFRFSGCNLYWLGLYQISGTGTLRAPTTFEIDDGINTAKEMGANVIRSHTLGISVGSSSTAFPTLASVTNNTPNATAFTSIDYAIYKAGLAGLRIVVPLCDHNRYYYGGKHTFTDWRSISDETQFYSNSTVIADYKQYISNWLNHVNQYNSLAYKNDPTILCWETINEGYNPFPGATWTDTISTYIKSIDSNHLVLDGSYGVQSGNLSLTNVDIYSNHLYPPQISLATSDATSTSGASKAYLVGEVDWRPGITGGAGTQVLDNTTSADGSQSVAVTTTGSSTHVFNVQINQKNLALSSGVTYTVSFYAKSTVNQTIQVAIQKAVTPFTIYAQPNVVISTTWAQYSFTFTTGGVTESNAQIAFNLAGSIATVWLDLVSITASGVGNLLSDPSFENGTLTPPWNFSVITTTPDTYPSFASSVEGNTAISGDLIWQLMPHNDTSGFTRHDDGFAIYYPCTSDASQATQIQSFRSHAYTMQGVSVPGAGTITQTPIITGSTIGAGVGVANNSLTWSGVAGAKTYLIQSGPSKSGPWTTVNSTTTDLTVPFIDSIPTTMWYQIAGVNVDGVIGPFIKLILLPNFSSVQL